MTCARTSLVCDTLLVSWAHKRCFSVHHECIAATCTQHTRGEYRSDARGHWSCFHVWCRWNKTDNERTYGRWNCLNGFVVAMYRSVWSRWKNSLQPLMIQTTHKKTISIKHEWMILSARSQTVKTSVNAVHRPIQSVYTSSFLKDRLEFKRIEHSPIKNGGVAFSSASSVPSIWARKVTYHQEHLNKCEVPAQCSIQRPRTFEMVDQTNHRRWGWHSQRNSMLHEWIFLLFLWISRWDPAWASWMMSDSIWRCIPLWALGMQHSLPDWAEDCTWWWDINQSPYWFESVSI